MAKLNWKLQSFLLYAACIDGMMGAFAEVLGYVGKRSER